MLTSKSKVIQIRKNGNQNGVVNESTVVVQLK